MHLPTAALLPLLSACTVIQVNGPVRATYVKMGVVRIEAANMEQTLVLRTEGFGLVPGISGLTLGYSRETVAAIGDSAPCRLILFSPSVTALQSLDKLAAARGKKIDSICEAGGAQREENSK